MDHDIYLVFLNGPVEASDKKRKKKNIHVILSKRCEIVCFVLQQIVWQIYLFIFPFPPNVSVTLPCKNVFTYGLKNGFVRRKGHIRGFCGYAFFMHLAPDVTLGVIDTFMDYIISLRRNKHSVHISTCFVFSLTGPRFIQCSQ